MNQRAGMDFSKRHRCHGQYYSTDQGPCSHTFTQLSPPELIEHDGHSTVASEVETVQFPPWTVRISSGYVGKALSLA